MAGHAWKVWFVALMLTLATSAAPAAEPVAGGAAAAGDTIFEDNAGQASASVVQVLPNAPQFQQSFSNVERISIKQDVFVIHWGKGAITILPRQFVSSITINRRSAPAKAEPEK